MKVVLFGKLYMCLQKEKKKKKTNENLILASYQFFWIQRKHYNKKSMVLAKNRHANSQN